MLFKFKVRPNGRTLLQIIYRNIRLLSAYHFLPEILVISAMDSSYPKFPKPWNHFVKASVNLSLHDESFLARVKCRGCAQSLHGSRIMEVATHFRLQPVEICNLHETSARIPGTWLARTNMHRVQWIQNNCELRWPLQVDTWKEDPQGDSTWGERTQSFPCTIRRENIFRNGGQLWVVNVFSYTIHAQTVGHRAPPLALSIFFPSYCDVSKLSVMLRPLYARL
jgi:hypothetical protein